MTNALKAYIDRATCDLRDVPGAGATTSAMLRVLIGVCVLTLSAKVQIPFYPVPMTMQTLAIVLIGGLYGWRLGLVTVGSYLAVGAAGLPVFAGPVGGIAYMAGPTGGFLAGFLLAVAATGYLTQNGRCSSIPRLALAMTAGHVLIFAAGLGYLSLLVSIPAAWAAGAAPFLLGTAVKTAIAVLFMYALRTRTR